MKRTLFRGQTLFTVGHSNRTLEDFVALLFGAGIGHIADVRRFPMSRRHPHFSAPFFARSLAQCGIGYTHLEQLGGRRRARPDTRNLAWRNMSFRGYADHLQTAEFEEGLRELSALLRSGPVALMCSEAVPWRCHRYLVSDALLARGAEVLHVVGPGKPRKHSLPSFAVRRGTTVTYP